jgi:hypothetical protein
VSGQFISIFFSVIFLAFLTAPTIIVLVDDSVDISIFYASAEEEETGNEKNKDVEKIIFEAPFTTSAFTQTNMVNELTYIYKEYAKPHLNLVSPPPEQLA